MTYRKKIPETTLHLLTCAGMWLFGIAGIQAQDQVVDHVKYRIVYKTEFVKDTTQRDSTGNYVYTTDEMCLDIGDSVSTFYSARTRPYYDWVDRAIRRGGEADPDSPQPPRANLTAVSYSNYPTGICSLFLKEAFTSYRIDEPAEQPQWTLTGDTCTLLGYSCTRAETFYKGRQWSAWFADDIPIDQGPWQLGGLPGLILKAEDARRQWTFRAVALSQPAGNETLTLVKQHKRYEKLTWAQYVKLRRTISRDDQLQALFARTGVKIQGANPDGTEMTGEPYCKTYKTIQPFNPIDLSE